LSLCYARVDVGGGSGGGVYAEKVGGDVGEGDNVGKERLDLGNVLHFERSAQSKKNERGRDVSDGGREEGKVTEEVGGERTV
jgi:hypothetical protein